MRLRVTRKGMGLPNDMGYKGKYLKAGEVFFISSDSAASLLKAFPDRLELVENDIEDEGAPISKSIMVKKKRK